MSPTQSPTEPLLRMRGITKQFAGTTVLHGVEFELRPGEVHILAGENGAGKSTLIKILAGVHAADAGEVVLEGTPRRFRTPQESARAGVSVIHQELSLIPAMSVSDNIFLGRERCATGGWMRYESQRAACEALIERLGLDVDPGRPVEDYPLSVQQSIEIAKALAFDARIIVMDEPTSALTKPEVERLFAVIEELRAAGHGIVYISHKMEEIYRIADRITVLRDGQYIGTAPAAELPREELIRWMVGRTVDEQFPRHMPHLGDTRLEVRGLTVADPGGRPRPAVDGVSFSVRAGEIVGVGGLEGSGASVMLGAIFGAHGRPLEGEVTLDGAPYLPRSPRGGVANGVALLTNDRKTTGLVLGMGVTENVTLASVPRFSPGGWIRRDRESASAARHRDAFTIRLASLGQAVETLSGGNQQKVALAKWLETEPKVLLLDEPTRGVDVGAKQEIYELMNRWTAEGIAIVLITSEMPELLALSDRVLVMHRGAITAEFSREEATQEGILAAAMGKENVT